MCSKDVTEVYAQLQLGALVRIIPDSLPKLPKLKNAPTAPSSVIFTASAPEKPVTPAINSAATGKPDRPQKRVSAATAPPSGDRA
jgi:hypothetical protein